MSTIEIIGLGAGDVEQLQLGTYRRLTTSGASVYTRTKAHPVIQSLEQEGISFESFDEFYEAEEQFQDVYKRIAATLVEQAKEEAIIYTVPGHPMLAERTVQLLLEQEEVEVTIKGGQSYLDDLFTSLNIDPIEGFQFVDGTSFWRNQLDLRHHLIFCQVYDALTASEVKLSLLEELPFDYQITVIDAAGTKNETIKQIPLEELDRDFEMSNLTSIYVPPAPSDLLNHTFTNLREVIRRLRAPDGCPWDRVQTHESLRSHAIEEVYELIDAINAQDDENMVEELGDLLLQVMLHSQIGADDGYFTIDDVIQGLNDKMIYRHPHVFGDAEAQTEEDVHQNWEALKQKEKQHLRKSVLDGVPKSLSALSKAEKLQKKAAKVGFEWNDVSEVWLKLDEEIQEVQEQIAREDQVEIEKELGDVLFVVANLSRYYKVNPEIALSETNQKFITRFTFIEEELKRQEKDIHQVSLEEMDMIWNQAKERE